MARSLYKRADETLTITLDFSEFIAEHPDAVISYSLRAEVGVVVNATLDGAGRFTLTVTGGIAGRSYRFGIEASSDDGDADVQMVMLRLREVPGWEGIPVAGDVGSGTQYLVLVDGAGNVLVDVDGNALVLPG